MERILYGATKKDMLIMRKRLFSEGIPIIGIIPNPKSKFLPGKLVYIYPDGHKEYKNQTMSDMRLTSIYSTDITYSLNKARMELLEKKNGRI